MRCFAYSYLETFDYKKLYGHLCAKYKINRFEDVYHFKVKDNNVNDGEGDIFIFPYGAIVTWGIDDESEDIIVHEMRDFIPSLTKSVFDDDLYTYSYDKNPSIKEDHIILPSNKVENKLACSFALSQSAKLGAYENSIQNTINITRELPIQLAETGETKLSAKEIRKLMGKIFIDKSSINLYLELLDTPNFFWDNTELEPLYEMINEYVDQDGRLKIINKRIEVMHELLEMLVTELNNQHSSKLEWIIIILIFIEVTVMFAKEVFHLI